MLTRAGPELQGGQSSTRESRRPDWRCSLHGHPHAPINQKAAPFEINNSWPLQRTSAGSGERGRGNCYQGLGHSPRDDKDSGRSEVQAGFKLYLGHLKDIMEAELLASASSTP